ncbi:MAG: DUF4012 domain-containing protein [Candidatus Kerfeldbacteria bacterium]|nr:DUF4012 domain-containing protein [Candidatus Kerfeldbacteria bacterium]
MEHAKGADNRAQHHDVPLTNVVDLRRLAGERNARAARSRRTQRAWLWFRRRSAPAPRPRQSPLPPPPKRPSAPSLPPRLVLKRISPFAALAALFLVPVLVFGGIRPLLAWEDELVRSSSAALSTFTEAGGALQEYRFADAADRFAQAEAQFAEAQHVFDGSQGAVKTLLNVSPFTRGKVQDGQRLLTAGHQLSSAGETFARTLVALLETPTQPGERFPIAKTFLSRSADVAASLHLVAQALLELDDVNPHHLPRKYRAAFSALQDNLAMVHAQLGRSAVMIPLLEHLFGSDRPRELLFVFENDTELRPGGGFLGSLALVRFDQGGFKILDAPGRGPFAVNDYFPKHLVPPQPVSTVAPIWTLHDANWFAHFPTSAEKVTWFYEQARGFAIDGLVALTPRVVERVLAATGPLPMPAYGVVLTEENFVRTTQDQVELAYDIHTNQPKQFVIDLIPAVLERLGSVEPDDLVAVLSALEESFRTKDLMLWLRDDAQRSSLHTLGWTGALPSDDGDFLAVVEANLGGGKTSRALERSATLDVKIVDETMENTLQLTIRHAGTPGDRWTGVRYRGYVKIYLPAGSVLLESRGFDRLPSTALFPPPDDAELDADLLQIEKQPVLDELSGTRKTEEFGRVAFGNWIELQPGEVQTVTFRYRSGARIDRQSSGDQYRLTIAKQPGAAPLPFEVQAWSGQDLRFATVPVTSQERVVSFSSVVDSDQRFALLFKR